MILSCCSFANMQEKKKTSLTAFDCWQLLFNGSVIMDGIMLTVGVLGENCERNMVSECVM